MSPSCLDSGRRPCENAALAPRRLCPQGTARGDVFGGKVQIRTED
jgi:hypothetical protein